MTSCINMSRRNILKNAFHEAFCAFNEARNVVRQATDTRDFFISQDKGFTMSRHYPRELFEDDAKRLGIDIDKVGIDEAVRIIFESKSYE